MSSKPFLAQPVSSLLILKLNVLNVLNVLLDLICSLELYVTYVHPRLLNRCCTHSLSASILFPLKSISLDHTFSKVDLVTGILVL